MSDIKPSEAELKAARAIADDYCPCNDIVHDIGSPLQAITCGSCEAVEETLATIIAQHTRYEGKAAQWWAEHAASVAFHRLQDQQRAEKAEAALKKAMERVRGLEIERDEAMRLGEMNEHACSIKDSRISELQAERDGICAWVNEHCHMNASDPQIAVIAKSIAHVKELQAALAGRTVSCVCGTDEFKRKAQAEALRWAAEDMYHKECGSILCSMAQAIESGALRVGENEKLSDGGK